MSRTRPAGAPARLFSSLARALLLPALLVGVWWWAAAGAGSFYLPTPDTVATTFVEVWVSERFLTDALPSIGLLLTGFTLAAVLGVGAGLALGLSRTLRALTEPVLEFLRAVPPPVLVPLLMPSSPVTPVTVSASTGEVHTQTPSRGRPGAYRNDSPPVPGVNARPTRITAACRNPASSTASAISPTVPCSTASSGPPTRWATTTGQSAPYSGSIRSMSSRTRRIARCSTSVARVAANASNVSVSGIALDRDRVRVSTTDCATNGTVSSRPTSADAAA